MHVLIGKRQILLAALTVMLGLAVFVNWYYTNNGASLSPEGAQEAQNAVDASDGAASYVNAEAEEEYFANVRLNRETALSSALEELEAVMASAGEGSDEAQTVREKIAVLTANAKIESDIENLVSAQLGGSCVAVAGDAGIDVIVPRALLTETNVLQISDIIRGVCGTRFENVRVAAAMT